MIFNENNQILFRLRNKNPEKADSELHGEGTWTFPDRKIKIGRFPWRLLSIN